MSAATDGTSVDERLDRLADQLEEIRGELRRRARGPGALARARGRPGADRRGGDDHGDEPSRRRSL